MSWKRVSKPRSLFGPLHSLFLLDLSWLLHRYYHSMKHLSVNIGGEVISTGDIYGVLKEVLRISMNFPYAGIVLCVDDKISYRKTLASEYKSQRESHPEVYAKLPEILTASQLLPHVYAAWASGYEADDLIFSLSRLGGKESTQGNPLRVYIYSKDKDLYQCVNDFVTCFSAIEKTSLKKQIIPAYIEDSFEVSPERLPFLRAIEGDSSDNLKRAYPRFPKKLIVKLVNRYEDPQDLLSRMTEAEKKTNFVRTEQNWIGKLLQNPEPMLLNFNLMKLKPLSQPNVFKGEGSWDPIIKYSMRKTRENFQEVLQQVKPLSSEETSSPS